MACEEGLKLQNKFAKSVVERVSAEGNLGTGVGTFQQRWDRFEAAKEDWSKAVHDRFKHIHDCRICFQEPPH
jgi:hypothetical protein